ncbi:MerR family transcriptional regulator [Clostridium sardiniense]|uniref:MerR family transcriptional regulator n=1 Tax=Clostridium sardiniense TaxID=29369 RepID=UPI003D33BDEA
MKLVNEVASLAGISKRTLQHYNDIGLLVASESTKEKYLEYSNRDVERLWKILLYLELDFTIEEIKEVLDGEKLKEEAILKEHKNILHNKRKRLEGLIDSIDSALLGEFKESMLEDFNKNRVIRIEETCRIDEFKEEYLKNSKAKKSKGDDVLESNLLAIKTEGEKIYDSFVEVMPYGVESKKTQVVMEDFQKYMNDTFSIFSIEEFERLSEVYIKDKSFSTILDSKKTGLGEFIGQAIVYWF